MNHLLYLLVPVLFLLVGCNRPIITEQVINHCLDSLIVTHPDSDPALIERGVRQVACQWTREDGTKDDFENLVLSHLTATSEERTALFNSLSRIFEHINQYNDLMYVSLQFPVTLTDRGEPTEADLLINDYFPGAHVSEDFYANKLAFIIMLNFPAYTLSEKDDLGAHWTREQWAMARLGDVFAHRVPTSLTQQMQALNAQTERYIASYNIHTSSLVNKEGQHLWTEPKSLLAHWYLRDELKTCYALGEQAKQELIYEVFQHIVRQTIPACVIDQPQTTWCPTTNLVNGKPADREQDNRYATMLSLFHYAQQEDAYYPAQPTLIQRTFENSLEISEAEVVSLFEQTLSSQELKDVIALVRQRLGRDLRPYDLWYNGFRSQDPASGANLNAVTSQRYPSAQAYKDDMPRMFRAFGFTSDRAQFLADHIVVEPARGSGHEWPSLGREEPSRLRTRVGENGMDYLGYNIAVHEMGHSVENITSLFIDQYFLQGVPNSAFTETSAFLFQQRDLQLLGQGKVEELPVVDIFWSMAEIMAVSLVDIRSWHWMYDHSLATPAELREAVLGFAREVWNTYFAESFGERDSEILAVYSHMIAYPLYLPNYAIGHLVQFQLEEHLSRFATPETLAKEYTRIYQQGRLTPQTWMQGATGQPLSVQPILRAVREILGVEE